MDLRPRGTMPTFVEFIYPVQTFYFSFLLSSNNLFNIKNDNYYQWSTVFSLGSFYLVWENVTSVFFMSIQDIISLWFEWLKDVTLWCNLMSKWNFRNPWQAKQSGWFYWVWLVSSGNFPLDTSRVPFYLDLIGENFPLDTSRVSFYLDLIESMF